MQRIEASGGIGVKTARRADGVLAANRGVRGANGLARRVGGPPESAPADGEVEGCPMRRTGRVDPPDLPPSPLPRAADNQAVTKSTHQPIPSAGSGEPQTGQGTRGAAITGLIRRHGPPAAATGLVVSFLIHLMGAMVAAVLSFGIAQAGGAGSGQGPVELAVMTQGELAEIQEAALDAGAGESPELPGAVLSADVPLDISPGLPGVGTGLGDISTDSGGGDIGEGLLGEGGGGGGGAANFFGVEARGTRFAYIVDVSGSMAPLPGSKTGRIDVLQLELSKSLNALAENAAYTVLLYNDRTTPLGGEVRWTEASDTAKRRAREQIDRIEASGGTEPVESFMMVLKMRPKPDAIYFMTDGEFPESYREQIRMLNGAFKVPIHCIVFGTERAATTMRGIAQDSGGTYTFVPEKGP